MAAAGRFRVAGAQPCGIRVALRAAIIAAVLALWEIVAESGWLFRDVVPTLPVIGRAIARVLGDAGFYSNLAVTAAEIVASLAIGGIAGVAVGLLLGGSQFLSRAYEVVHLLPRPDAEDHFLPDHDHVVRRRSRLEDRDGRAVVRSSRSSISVAAGMRQIAAGADPRRTELPRDAVADDAKIYFPAMREPIVNGFRLGLGVAIIGTLLAETKLSNRGLGYLIIQSYTTFDMPRMYALLIVLFVIAIGAQHTDRPLRRQRSRTPVMTLQHGGVAAAVSIACTSAGTSAENGPVADPSSACGADQKCDVRLRCARDGHRDATAEVRIPFRVQIDERRVDENGILAGARVRGSTRAPGIAAAIPGYHPGNRGCELRPPPAPADPAGRVAHRLAHEPPRSPRQRLGRARAFAAQHVERRLRTMAVSHVMGGSSHPNGWTTLPDVHEGILHDVFRAVAPIQYTHGDAEQRR